MFPLAATHAYAMERLLTWNFWVQFSIFCSITRLHGDRNPKEAPNTVPLQEQCDPTGAAGGPIEPWVLGNEAYEAVKAALSLRASMLPYLKEQVALLATRGTPVMRPLWFDFSSDPRAVRDTRPLLFVDSCE
jgi:alpha-D-xyloside xylohydrolase